MHVTFKFDDKTKTMKVDPGNLGQVHSYYEPPQVFGFVMKGDILFSDPPAK